MSVARATLSLLLLGSWTHVSFGVSNCNVRSGVTLPTSQADCDAFKTGSVYMAITQNSGHCMFVVKGNYTSDQCSRTICAGHSSTGGLFWKTGATVPAWAKYTGPGNLADANGGWLGGVFEPWAECNGGTWNYANGCQLANNENKNMKTSPGCCNVCMFMDTSQSRSEPAMCDQGRNCICQYPLQVVNGSGYDTVMTKHLQGCSGSSGSISLVAHLGAAAALVSVTRMLM